MLLATDLDGTFLAGDPEDRLSLYQTIAAHPEIKLAYVTGRSLEAVLPLLAECRPADVLLVLDATTGHNALEQVRVFKEMVDVTGLVVTKLDGSARGGIVVALAQDFGLPVHAVGVGEQAADLRPFEAMDYARGLVGR